MITEEITNQTSEYKPEVFNWESTGKGGSDYSAEERTKWNRCTTKPWIQWLSTTS